MEAVISGYDQVKWEVVRDQVVLEHKNNKQIFLRIFNFTVFQFFGGSG